MPVDLGSRSALRDALIAYMRADIRTFAFDDVNTRCMDANDPGLVEVARTVWTIHHDFVNHPISVSAEAWNVLRRVVAFLATDLPPAPVGRRLAPFWPFRDAAEHAAHEHLSRDCDLPDYDPGGHNRPIHPWWFSIPTSVGIALIAAFLALVFGLMTFTARR